MFYRCFSCSKVIPLMGATGEKCPSCGGTNGAVLSKERFDEGFKAGTIHNIDPKTGKAAKKRK